MAFDRSTRRGLLAAGLGATALALFVRAPFAQTPPGRAATARRIGVVGSGNIGGTIGGLWVGAGHEVLFSSRNPEALKPLVDGLGTGARAGTPAEAIAFGEAVLLAVPYKAYPDIARAHGAALKGKVLIDAGNATAARDGALHEEVTRNGIAATSAKYLSGARVVRAFNAANFRVFERNANRAAPRMAIPIAGDDAAALDLVGQLVREAGFEPVVVGGLAAADRFAMGSPGFGHDLGAPELRAKLGLAP